MSAASVPEAALRHCRAITRQRARNFYYGLKLLPEPKRSALYAIYAWMRRADDIADAADAPPDVALARLETFAQRTEAVIGGAAPVDGDPLWAALAYTASQYALPVEPFRAMVQGQRDDLSARQYETLDELLDYCRKVASSVGLVCIRIWGHADDRAPVLAADRGIAFQLTNIIRDFAEDFDEGRVYLPAEDFRAHGLTPADLRCWSSPSRCARFLQSQVGRTREYYDRSADLDSMIDESCRPTLWAMTSIYSELLEKAATNPGQIVSRKRLRLHSLTKATIAVRARWMLRGLGQASA